MRTMALSKDEPPFVFGILRSFYDNEKVFTSERLATVEKSLEHVPRHACGGSEGTTMRTLSSGRGQIDDE